MSLKKIRFMTLLMMVLAPQSAFAMHVMEGFLPPYWALGWTLIFIPFLLAGLFRLRSLVGTESSAESKEGNDNKVLLALCGAFVFVLSALKIPSVTGSCSHPTGVGLGVVLFGPRVMAVLGLIVLLFQALFLAHGGITTLGANAFSMAVVGPAVGYGIWKLSQQLAWRRNVGVFLCALFANLATYFVTSLQLGLAFPDPQFGFVASTLKFMAVFCLTQIPIAIAEGLMTVLIDEQISKRQLSPLLGS